MTRAGLAAIAHEFDPNEKPDKNISIAPDILKPLKANTEAWKNFCNFPDSYKRIRIAYIEERRRQGQEMFEKSLNYFIARTARNKRIGFVKEWTDC